MKLRILVFDPDVALRELLEMYLSKMGHDVQAFADPTVCPLFQNISNENCRCSREVPCGDVVMMNMRMPQINALDFLRLQRRRGCKALDVNKAVMSTSVTKEVAEAMAILGCHHLAKPFRLADVRKWVEECSARISKSSDF